MLLPRITSLDTRTLCLGVLTEGSASGYEIRKLLMERFGHFMRVSYGSIYPALASLLDEGLVECQEISQHSRPDKKTYRLTAAGEQAFVASLQQSPGRHRVRSEFLALLCFAHYLPADCLRRLLDEREQEFREDTAEADTWLQDDGAKAPAGMRFAAGFGVALLRAACNYIEENRQTLTPAHAD